MFRFCNTLVAVLLLAAAQGGFGQTDEPPAGRDAEQLRMAAVEALISAPPEKALPILTRVLEGQGSEEIKERALFVLSQIELPEARALLGETARSASGSLRHEAIRMIGISGDTEALADLYAGADPETKEAILEAFLIAGDADAVYRIAAGAQDADEFEAAVEVLGAMGATEQLRQLRNRTDMSESLIQAYAIAGDSESLLELARDAGSPERQAEAIRALGIVGGDDAGEVLAGIYADADSPLIREAVLEGLVISDDDEAVLQLYRRSQDNDEKVRLLETLVMMDSEAVWDIIDDTLDNGQ